MRPPQLLRDRMRADEIALPPALCFSCDEDEGYLRQRRGTGFAYTTPSGERPNAETLARIRSLAIPPAWTNVWICKDRQGHLQATGRDERGRKQYRYHPDWTQHRSGTKFETLVRFAEALPLLREQVESDLRRRSLTYERVIASAVWLLDHSLIRVGNPTYARDNKSFGLTTLRHRHVEINGGTLQFRFKGKSGKQWRVALTDRRMARLIRSLQDLPGQHLFQYEDESGYRSITSRDVNDYIAAATSGPFSSKNFRTWAGTVRAFSLLADLELPDSRRQQTMALNSVFDAVSTRLGNTRTVCRQSYVHPGVPATWLNGTLRRSGRLKPVDGLDGDEVEAAHFLRKLGRASAAQ